MLAWEGDWFDIDPTVWIDDDNQAYMYWGNPELKAVKLNEDMISYSDSIMHFPKIQDYQEGPWFWKRNGNYYLAYASTCCPEGIGYAMSKNPLGPWEYKGHIMNHTPRTRGNHPGSIEIRLDGVNGQCIGKVDISNTKDEYKIFSTQVKKVKGVHDLYFVFKGGDIQKQNLFFLDWWKFGELL